MAILGLEGPIEAGDTEKLKAVLDQTGMAAEVDYDTNVLLLNSPGGDFREAIRMMDLLYERTVRTYVWETSECLSACAIVFLAGTGASPDSQFPHRTIRPGGRLGIHAPSIPDLGDTMLPASEMNLAYSEALASMSEIASRADLFQIPNSLVVQMLTTPPEKMYMIETIGDANRWGVKVDIQSSVVGFAQDEIVNLCKSYNSYRDGELPYNFGSGLEQTLTNDTPIEYFQLKKGSRTENIAVVLNDMFKMERCGVTGYDTDTPRVIYSYGDSASLVQTFETLNWVDEFAGRQHTMDPATQINSLPIGNSLVPPSTRCPTDQRFTDDTGQLRCKIWAKQ